MNNIEQLELNNKQTDEFYKCIGEFVVCFEQTCHSMHNTIMSILDNQGLKNQKVTRILLSTMGAFVSCNILQSLISELKKDLTNTEKNKINELFTRILELIQFRNLIIHGKWYIGWGNEMTTDYSEATLLKHDKNKKGANLKIEKFDANNIKTKINEAKSLKYLLDRLNGCLISNLSIEKNLDTSIIK